MWHSPGIEGLGARSHLAKSGLLKSESIAMTPEREKEYEELLGYVCFFATVIWKIDPASNIHPAKTMEEITRQFGKSKALAGLRQAANDTIEQTSNWNLKTRVIVDKGFKAAGMITVSEIARRYSSIYKRIIKRGHIKNDTEYYVINANLIDQGNAVLHDKRIFLQKIIDAYEVNG